jgi:hypothetical protein
MYPLYSRHVSALILGHHQGIDKILKRITVHTTDPLCRIVFVKVKCFSYAQQDAKPNNKDVTRLLGAYSILVPHQRQEVSCVLELLQRQGLLSWTLSLHSDAESLLVCLSCLQGCHDVLHCGYEGVHVFIIAALLSVRSVFVRVKELATPSRRFSDEFGRDASGSGCLRPGVLLPPLLGIAVASLQLAAFILVRVLISGDGHTTRDKMGWEVFEVDPDVTEALAVVCSTSLGP